MLIVPDQDSLKVEAKVAPQDVDQLHMGQAVSLRFSAIDQRTSPVINGTLTNLSPDTTVDPKTEQRYYKFAFLSIRKKLRGLDRRRSCLACR